MQFLILAPIAHLSTMPTGIEPINWLISRGHRVDLLTCRHPSHPVVDIGSDLLSVRSVYTGDGEASKLRMILCDMPRLISICRRSRRYDAVIAISQMGIIYAEHFWRHESTPIVYLADEIRLPPTGGGLKGAFKRHLKRLEIAANRAATFSIVQDDGRADLLARVNCLPRDLIMTLPNSRIGKATRRPSRYLREMFELDDRCMLLLSMGMVSSLNMSQETVREANQWPADVVLVLHNRYDQGHEPCYQAILRERDPCKVMLSNRPVSFADLDRLVSSADIGVALYSGDSENLTTMGYSSGKICGYLRNGVPAIVQDFDSLRWVEESGSGLCVAGPDEVLAAARRIKENYDAFSKAALRTYDGLLSFDAAFGRIMARLDAAITAANIQDGSTAIVAKEK